MNLQSKLPKIGTNIFSTMSQLALEHKAVNLGQGFPDFSVPEALLEGLDRAMRDNKNQYAPMIGVPALRQAISAKAERCYGRRVNPDTEVTVTHGASEAIMNAMLAVVGAGDEVIVLDPCYDQYEPCIELAGGRAVHVPLNDADFSVNWQRVRDAISPRTRMLILNSPHNPCGATTTPADLDAAAEILRDTNIMVLSDEVYEHIIFDGRPHQSVLRHPELAARSFSVSSFGKTYHCTGWKVGYCIAPPALTTEFRKVHQYNAFCSVTPVQWAFADMLTNHPEHYENLPSFYQAKRDHFREQLAQTRFKLRDVQGGYFQLVDYSPISDLPDVEFARWMTIEKGVTAIPLSPFYEKPQASQRLVRLCFAKNEATLNAAIELLVKL